MIKKLEKIIPCLTIVLLALATVICNASMDATLSTYLNQVKIRSPLPLEPVPSFKKTPSFHYPEQDKRRDPFQSAFAKKSDANNKNPKQKLQNLSLSALKWVGFLRHNDMVWALIGQANGDVAVIKPGDYLGPHEGLVSKISENLLQIDEVVQVEGKWMKKITTLRLKIHK